MNQNNLPGVFVAYKKDKTKYFRSSMTFRNKHISLGSYETAEEAHEAYVEGINLVHSSEYTIEDYRSQKTVLSFDKWVSLINFRDNSIYIANPIYIRPKMFYYYLSMDDVLKFDVEDLFFYSSHKIMRRGGHLFVSNYGLQLNIVNRYGIKNHGIIDVDYRFRNGDTYDFRYSNIEILNSYQGVREIKVKNKSKYKSFIHINGNYVIGTYSTITEAAIAYNKAADILKSKGYKKAYATNFIDDISPSEYAEIYSKIKISQKILDLP